MTNYENVSTGKKKQWKLFLCVIFIERRKSTASGRPKTFDKFRFSSGRKQFCHENPIFNFDFYFLVAYRMRKLDRKFSNVFLKRNYFIFRRIIFLNMFFNFQKFRKNVKYYQNIKFNFWTFFWIFPTIYLIFKNGNVETFFLKIIKNSAKIQ